MTPKELEDAGRKLYGHPWRSKLARALARDPGAVTHWMNGKTIPKTVERRIRDLLKQAAGTQETEAK